MGWCFAAVGARGRPPRSFRSRSATRRTPPEPRECGAGVVRVRPRSRSARCRVPRHIRVQRKWESIPATPIRPQPRNANCVAPRFGCPTGQRQAQRVVALSRTVGEEEGLLGPEGNSVAVPVIFKHAAGQVNPARMNAIADPNLRCPQTATQLVLASTRVKEVAIKNAQHRSRLGVGRWCWPQVPLASSATAAYPLAGRSSMRQSDYAAGCYVGVAFRCAATRRSLR
jgi:hypothetical protein